MIKKILNVDGVKALTKTEQHTVLGGIFINCKPFSVNNTYYIECYDLNKEEYIIVTTMGTPVDCDEIYDH
ncbi:hypothetical protein [Kordia jejudonensis]|uniref:hypothetical protein n=1 Tax=Kordia jejudonensis TaxID=1348245 RepID=UPI0006296985|nr:hypothetical protein [Kordia jejudonensis]